MALPSLSDAAAAVVRAPVQRSESQVSPAILTRLLLDVRGDVGLRPLLVRLQGGEAVAAQRGDLSPAARRGEEPGAGGGSEVDEGGFDQLLRRRRVDLILNGEAELML